MSSPTRDATKSVAIQAAEYGMHRLVCSHDITHAFTIILENTVFYISWYDREGILTTSGIDIAYHLEYYLVLLFILQRFNRTDWGRTGHPQLVTTPRANAGEKCSGMTRIEVEGKKFVFDTANPKALLHKSMAIRGRNTTVWEGQLVLENDEFSSEKYAIKFSWKEKTRKSEAEILRLITERANGQRDILDYLPLVVASHVFSDVETGAIRAYMNVLEPKRAPRELVVTVTTKLKGRITELEPDDVWHVWWDCFKCHYKLWKLGIQHRDISTANIMYWEDAATGAKYGVLIDFDLAAIEGEASNNQQRTGTRPFLAMDFLRDDGASVLHAYKHDVEAFCWVAVYVATCCESVDKRQLTSSTPPMLKWAYVDNQTLLEKKEAFLYNPNKFKRTEKHEPGWGRWVYILRKIGPDFKQPTYDVNNDLVPPFLRANAQAPTSTPTSSEQLHQTMIDIYNIYAESGPRYAPRVRAEVPHDGPPHRRPIYGRD
ncbi:hypothetical protein FS842_009798 [Serendipita sp. 407]|nr:hypothetical protein FS842_009798 [Serendipita sp. 407]